MKATFKWSAFFVFILGWMGYFISILYSFNITISDLLIQWSSLWVGISLGNIIGRRLFEDKTLSSKEPLANLKPQYSCACGVGSLFLIPPDTCKNEVKS